MKYLAALGLLGFLAITSGGARTLQLEDYYRIQTASAPAISPDGRWVVFVRTGIVEAENRRHSTLWISPSDGSMATAKLTSGDANESDPRWSPDGKLIAFRSDRAGHGADSDTWFVHMDASPDRHDPFQIPGVGGAPIFSPDNRWIAFTKKTPPPPDVPTESPLEKQLSERFKGRVYDWMNVRFDQRGYLTDPRDPHASPPHELYVVARQGGAPQQLTHLNVDVTVVRWRPDSGALAIIADSHQRDEYSYPRADLWVVDLQKQIRRLTDDGFEYAAPTWSPDGKTLAFLRSQSLNQILDSHQKHGAAIDIYRMPATGGSMQNLTPDFDLIPESPQWNGDAIYFTAEVGGDGHLFRLVASGNAPVQITQGDRALAGFSFSEHFDRIAYVAQDSAHPAEAFSASIEGASEHQLSHFNDNFLHEVELHPAERIHFASKDGTPIEGWIIKSRAAAPYPLVLNIHGGPHMAFGNQFDFEFQWLSNNFAVLYTNPRGSTGYGEKFLWATWNGWGKLDYQDVMAGVDYAIAHFPVDSKRLGVTGYSYGGFLTNWVITQTTRFQAAVVGAGISNWLSDYGTADIPRTKETEFSGAPWNQEAGERLRSLSPITYAGNVRTPTLFVHGESDMRVPIEEGEQMYTALKKQHVPAKFIRYPGNYHGGWPPWDMVHRYYEEMTWLSEYLKPAGDQP
jgi:dipeptidyl aminopeptidase/acylaminoacyl peptidase